MSGRACYSVLGCARDATQCPQQPSTRGQQKNRRQRTKYESTKQQRPYLLVPASRVPCLAVSNTKLLQRKRLQCLFGQFESNEYQLYPQGETDKSTKRNGAFGIYHNSPTNIRASLLGPPKVFPKTTQRNLCNPPSDTARPNAKTYR